MADIITGYLDRIASSLEDAGHVDFAHDVDKIADTVEAAKKKWIQDVDLKKGRFTQYCKQQGYEGPNQGCAEKALKSDDPSVRGMASFYLAMRS